MSERKSVPDFELPATGNQRFRLSAFKGHPLILYFYPKDNTPGCTDESLQFRELHAEFAKAGFAVFGVSRDSVASHEKFKQKFSFPFELLSDADETACALFGAVCASAIATAVTMALVALPALKEYKYDTGLANGSLAAGGPIGSLIPPSGILLIYGIITENSIAQLFVGGIIPGIIVAGSYILMIGIRCWIKPELGPPGPSVPIIEKIKSLSEIWEIICLGILSIGGLTVGIFTATEAGAVGAAGAFVAAAIRRKLTWANTRQAFLSAMESSGMIFGVIVGAMIFNYFCAASNLPEHLTQWVAGFNLPPMGIMIIIVIIYIILGALMDESSIQLLTIPIFYPLILKLGFDPIWFGVIQCKLLNIGMIAPPVGITVFVIAGLDKTVPMATVYKGVMWFIFCDMFVMAALLYWPGLITWLPRLMAAG